MKQLRTTLLMVFLAIVGLAFAESGPKPSAPTKAIVSPVEQEQQWMMEGEKRYRANCGRCHQAPHKFPPRAMAMAVRHMRVRAMLTDDDMKYLSYYLTR